MGKRVGKYLWRTQPIGVCKGRAADMPGAKMVVEMGIGIPSCGNRAQTAGRRQLGENHRCQLRPGRHCLDVSVAVVATDDGVEYASFHRFEKFIEDAIVVAHVQPHFPCLTTRKCTGSRRSCWTCTATNRIFPGQYCTCVGMTTERGAAAGRSIESLAAEIGAILLIPDALTIQCLIFPDSTAPARA